MTPIRERAAELHASDYAPFPTEELKAMASYHASARDVFSAGSYSARLHAGYIRTCLDAIAAHEALRERCLTSELELNHGISEATVGASNDA